MLLRAQPNVSWVVQPSTSSPISNVVILGAEMACWRFRIYLMRWCMIWRNTCTRHSGPTLSAINGTTSCIEFPRRWPIKQIEIFHLLHPQFYNCSNDFLNVVLVKSLCFAHTDVIFNLFQSLFRLSIMDGEYIQYLKQEATASATRIISRVIAVSIYGIVGVYLLSTIMSDVLPKVAEILPFRSNDIGS